MEVFWHGDSWCLLGRSELHPQGRSLLLSFCKTAQDTCILLKGQSQQCHSSAHALCQDRFLEIRADAPCVQPSSGFCHLMMEPPRLGELHTPHRPLPVGSVLQGTFSMAVEILGCSTREMCCGDCGRSWNASKWLPCGK